MAKVVSSIIAGEIEICDNNGETKKVIPYRVNAARVADEVTRQRVNISTYSKAKDFDSVGKAVVELFNIIFGEDSTNELLAYYQDDYACLVADVFPVLSSEILPAIDSCRQRMVNARKGFKRG